MLRRLIVNTFVALIATIPVAAQETPVARQIVVTGEGQVQAAPDMATLSIGVGHEAPTAAEAMAEVSGTVQQIFTRLTELGVAPRDVQTASLRIDPIWRDRNRSTPEEPPEIVGFRAQNDIPVRLRDMARLGEVIGEYRVLSSGPIDDMMVNVYPGVAGASTRVDFLGNPALYSTADLATHHARFLDLLRTLVAAEDGTHLGDIDALAPTERASFEPSSARPAPLPELLLLELPALELLLSYAGIGLGASMLLGALTSMRLALGLGLSE